MMNKTKHLCHQRGTTTRRKELKDAANITLINSSQQTICQIINFVFVYFLDVASY